MVTSRLQAYVVSALLIGGSAYPMFLEPADDGYPLSTYPMFSWNRGTTSSVTSAVATGGGVEHAVPPSLVANAETMQALQTLKKSVRAGRRATELLCRRIASRVAEAGEFSGTTHIEIVTQKLDNIARLTGDAPPLGRRVHVRCPIAGRSQP